MNLKERLTSTENLLRTIRNKEGVVPKGQCEKSVSAAGSIWTRPISIGDLFKGFSRRKAEKPVAPSQAATPVSSPTAAAPASDAAPKATQAPAAMATPSPAPPIQAPPSPQVPAQPARLAELEPPPGTPAAPQAKPPEAPRPAAQAQPAPKPAEAAGSIWTRRISMGDLARSLTKATGKARPTATASKPLWSRQLSFGRAAKSVHVGISFCASCLWAAAVQTPGGPVLAARRFVMEPDQQPGEKGFPDFLRACMSDLGYTPGSADVWVVLRSSDLDLNVLSVPRLSGAKLDAAVYWTLQKEKKFAEAEYVLDYQPMGMAKNGKDAKLEVLTCLARRADVDRLRDCFRDAGWPLAGVTTIPNALLSLYRQPAAPKGYTLAANIHVEQDFSAIGLYAQDRLRFSRFIRSGAGSMAETLVDHFQDLARPKAAALDDLELPLPGASPAATTREQALTVIDSTQAQALLRHVLLGAPKPDFALPAHLMTPEAMLEVLAPAIERLARQVERTLDYFAQSTQARCDALHLSGEIFGSAAIAQALGSQLGFAPFSFDPAVLVGGGEGLPQEERMSLVPAIASALSPKDKGINLLYNYRTRTALHAKATVTRVLILGLAGFMLFMGVAGFVLESANKTKRQSIKMVKAQRAALGPGQDERVLAGLVNQYAERQEGLRQAAARLLVPAVVEELARRAPQTVRLVSLSADMAPEAGGRPGGPAPSPAKPQPKQTPLASANTVLIEGFVSGPAAEQLPTLSRYVIELESSPLFDLPTVTESGPRELGDHGMVLYFALRVGVK